MGGGGQELGKTELAHLSLSGNWPVSAGFLSDFGLFPLKFCKVGKNTCRPSLFSLCDLKKKNQLGVESTHSVPPSSLQPNKIRNDSVPPNSLNRTGARDRPMMKERNHSVPFHLILEPNTSLIGGKGRVPIIFVLCLFLG